MHSSAPILMLPLSSSSFIRCRVFDIFFGVCNLNRSCTVIVAQCVVRSVHKERERSSQHKRVEDHRSSFSCINEFEELHCCWKKRRKERRVEREKIIVVDYEFARGDKSLPELQLVIQPAILSPHYYRFRGFFSSLS